MGMQDLRRYVRFQLNGSAQLRLQGGQRVDCLVHNLSMGGAYVLREGDRWQTITVNPGDRVRLRVTEPQGPRFVLTAEVVRVEPDVGPGIALRFLLQDETIDPEPVFDYVQTAGQRVSAPPEALIVPDLLRKRQRGWAPARRVVRVVTRATTLAAVVSGLYLLYVWLEANSI